MYQKLIVFVSLASLSVSYAGLVRCVPTEVGKLTNPDPSYEMDFSKDCGGPDKANGVPFDDSGANLYWCGIGSDQVKYKAFSERCSSYLFLETDYLGP